jgi:RsiW-degrading membrane proteinase PrsW (M82 family)
MLGAVLPSLAWLLFFLKEDVRPEPKRLILYALSLGALSTIPALLFQVGAQVLLSNVFTSGLLAVILLALSEEFFKFLVVWLGIRRDPAFDEPIDAMVYMVAAALGFAMLENLFIIGGSFQSLSFVSASSTLHVIVLRFVGATLLHVLASALLGFYWAKKKIGLGLLVATFVHAVFNYLILTFPEGSFFYTAVFLILAAFFVLQDFDKLKIV